MNYNTKNLLDLLQDSLHIKEKKNLLPLLINNQKEREPIWQEFLEVNTHKNFSQGKSNMEVSIVKTKISEIAYKLRQEKRQFDNAFLLEQLTDQLLKKQTCLIAFKLSQDQKKDQTYLNSMNKIISLNNSSQIVQLLIYLQDYQNSTYQQSEFAKKFIQQKIKNCNDTLTLPNKVNYVESDTFLIERDKSTCASFISYDNTSFQNNEWDDQFNDQNLQNSLKEVNRFNKSLLEQDQNKSDQLMGALTRPQQSQTLFASPFNINFEIPSLPNISFGWETNEQQEIPSFFTYINNKQSDNKNIQWISKTPQEPNRRQIKQKNKKATKKQLLWNLMPYVKEELLPHNIQSEGGLIRLWEDEQLDIKMRDLKVSESGLLTSYKLKEFHIAFQNNMQTGIQVLGYREFTEEQVVNFALLMLQGIPSTLFQLEQATFIFTLKENFQITDYSLNKVVLSSIFEEMMEAGSFFLHLREFSDFLSNPQYLTGLILENFVLAIQDFLTYYQNEIINSKENIEKRRFNENKTIFQINDSSNISKDTKKVTILELRIHMTDLLSQIKLLATICFTKLFITQTKEEERKSDNNQIQLYNSKNLDEKLQLNLDMIRNKFWLKKFPKGAQLLNYLYKIILCCESDLQAIELLRKIFQKAIQPLLQMINMFIFTGDFADPFNEFFVEKMYKKGSDNKNIFNDFMFKITSETDIKIPAFFLEISPLIFKAGSQVHLLKRGEKINGINQNELNIYYQICCGETSNKFYMKLLQSDMTLEFLINTLRVNQENRQKAFENQAELLQEMEMKIVQDEEEQYYRQILLREQARSEYFIRKELERQKQNKEEQERKESMMKGIIEQIQEKQDLRVKERLQKIKENEIIRKEQEEYQRKKKAIAQELQRQYLELIKENQKLGDMRKQEIIAQEQLDKEVKQLQDQNKQQDDEEEEEEKSDQEEEQITNLKKQDIEMINENEEVQNVQENQETNLIQILDEVVSSNIPMPEIQSLNITHEDESDYLSVNQINLVQEEPKETLEDKLRVIQDLFIQPLMINVFKRIDEKRLMERKRRTWVQKRKQEKIEKAKEKRTKWKYQEPNISIKQKFNTIFQQFQNQAETVQSNAKQNVHLSNDIIVQQNVPTALALRQCVISVVKDQYKIVNKCLLHIIYRKLNLLKHLEALKQIYFCYQGDVISLFMHTLFNNDFESTLKDNSISYINEQFELSVKLSTPYQSGLDPIDNFGISTLANNFIFDSNKNSNSVMMSNQNFYFTAFNMGDFVQLLYQRDYPLDLIISDQCIQKYNSIFFFLLKLKRINQILSNLWKDLNGPEFKRLAQREYQKVRRIQFLRSKMQHFISMLEQYALTEVIEASWKNFKDMLTKITLFEDLIRLHNNYLDKIRQKCFIDMKDHKILGQIHKLYEFVNQLNKLVKEYGIHICNTENAIKEITIIEQQFDNYIKFLYELVKHLANKGSFNELYVMMDFNKFYDREQMQNQ